MVGYILLTLSNFVIVTLHAKWNYESIEERFTLYRYHLANIRRDDKMS